MNYVDRLIEALSQQLRHPWTQDKSSGERVWFLVFDADKMRSVLARKDEFKLTTEAAGKRWIEIDISKLFGAWMMNQRYASKYFARPNLATTITEDFAQAMVEDITRQIHEQPIDDQTLIVITGTESLYGINRLSHITKMLEDAIPTRLLVFFPGQYSNPQYRFLDAHDGWNYLAVPIIPISGRGNA
jgi:hypothetical protein